MVSHNPDVMAQIALRRPEDLLRAAEQRSSGPEEPR